MYSFLFSDTYDHPGAGWQLPECSSGCILVTTSSCLSFLLLLLLLSLCARRTYSRLRPVKERSLQGGWLDTVVTNIKETF